MTSSNEVAGADGVTYRWPTPEVLGDTRVHDAETLAAMMATRTGRRVTTVAEDVTCGSCRTVLVGHHRERIAHLRVTMEAVTVDGKTWRWPSPGVGMQNVAAVHHERLWPGGVRVGVKTTEVAAEVTCLVCRDQLATRYQELLDPLRVATPVAPGEAGVTIISDGLGRELGRIAADGLVARVVIEKNNAVLRNVKIERNSLGGLNVPETPLLRYLAEKVSVPQADLERSEPRTIDAFRGATPRGTWVDEVAPEVTPAYDELVSRGRPAFDLEQLRPLEEPAGQMLIVAKDGSRWTQVLLDREGKALCGWDEAGKFHAWASTETIAGEALRTLTEIMEVVGG